MYSLLFDRKYRNLLGTIIVSQFKQRQQGSVLGILWSVLNPLLMLTIVYVVFNHRMGSQVDHYAVYLLIGIVVYTQFANSTTAAMQVFESMSALTANAIFPKEVLVMAAVFSRSIEFAASCLICIGLAVLSGVPFSGGWAWLFVVIVMQTAFALSVSLVLSCLYLYLRDISHIYQVFLRLLFFLTPIFYTMEFLGNGWVRTLVLANPLTHLVKYARVAVLGGEPVGAEVLVAAFLTTVLLIFSLRVFRMIEPNLAERV